MLFLLGACCATKGWRMKITCLEPVAFSKMVLQEIGSWWGLSTSHIHSIEDLFGWSSENNLNNRQQKALMGTVYAHCWLIWQLRNGKIFKNPILDHGQIIFGQLKAIIFFWYKNRANCRDLKHNCFVWCNFPASCF